MPFYEYECQDCKFYTEVMQKISDPPLTKCPSCGKEALKKLVSAPNFRLKGSGWYETDFKSDGENKRNLAGADKEEPKAESKAETAESKESKPAEAKTPAAPPPEPSRKRATASVSKSPVKSAARSAPPKAQSKARSKPTSKAKPKAKAKGAARKGRR